MSAETIRYFYQPGCTSCHRTKQFLAQQGVDFEPINILKVDWAKDFLMARGIDMVPAIAKGERAIEAIQLGPVAAFLGKDYIEPEKLPPDILVDRYKIINQAAQRFVRLMPEKHLQFYFPERPRPFFELSYHAFNIARAGLIGLRTGHEPGDFQTETVPSSIKTQDDMAAFGRSVLDDLLLWWAEAGSLSDFDDQDLIDTWYGVHPRHDVLERTVWHSAQHVRQMQMFLQHFDVDIPHPLTPEDLQGLPLPDDVWLAE